MTLTKHLTFRGILVAALAALAWGCSDPAEAPAPTPDAPVEDEVAFVCPAPAMVTDGSCCPAGQVFEHATDACQPVGPPSCADFILTSPQDCIPRWCEVWRDTAGAACQPPADGCSPTPAPCVVDDPSSCAAGWWRPLPGQACIPAGLTGDATVTGADLPGLTAPVGVPPLVPLPALPDTRFCRGPNGKDTTLCDVDGAVDGGCGAGQMPDPSAASGCIAVGVPWLCPPGFEVDGDAKVPPGEHAPCRPAASACPVDLFGGVQEGPGVIYVHAAAPDGGDGSRAKPLRSIKQALNKAVSGGTIAVADGVYKEALVVTKLVALRGRCAATVRLQSPSALIGVQVDGKAAGARVLIRGMTIAGARYGLVVLDGLAARAESVWIDGSLRLGAMVSGPLTDLELVDVVIANTVDGGFGRGFGVGLSKGGSVIHKRVRLHRNRHAGLLLEGVGSRVTATELRIDDTRAGSTGLLGMGILLQNGANLQARSVRLSGNRLAGMAAQGGGAVGSIAGLVVDGTRPQDLRNQRGVGLMIQSGGGVALQGARLSANLAAGAALIFKGSSLLAHGLLVDGTDVDASTGDAGPGVSVQAGANATLVGVRLSGNRTAGLYAAGLGTEVEARDLLADGNLMPDNGGGGTGVSSADGARLVLDTARLSGNRVYGASAQVSSVLTITNALVDGTLPRTSDQLLGYGVVAQGGSSLTITGSRITAAHAFGLLASNDGTTMTARGLLIDGTLPRASDGGWGAGTMAQHGATLTLLGSRATGNRLAGIASMATKGTSFRATGVLVDRTRRELITDMFGDGAMLLGAGDKIELAHSLFAGNIAAAIAFSSGAGGTVRGCVMRDTQASQYDPTPDVADGLVVELADGLVAHNSALINVHDSLFTNQARAGLLLVNVLKATVHNTMTTQSHYGMVTQQVGELDTKGLGFFGNTLNQASDKGLQVAPPPKITDF